FSRPLGNQELIAEISENHPYPIARLLQIFVDIYDNQEADRAFREMIKLFAGAFKYTGLIIISDYISLLRKGNIIEPELTGMIDKFLYINLSGMSMGHWQYCLREITRLAMHNKIELFIPELIPLYWKNQKKPADYAKWIDNKMIPLRNDYVHSDIWIDSEIAHKMIREYLPSLIGYLQEIAFLKNYPLKMDLDKKFFLQKADSKLMLDYFIIYSQKDEWSKDEMLLFETLKGKSIKYLLGNFYDFESEYIENLKSVQAFFKERISDSEPGIEQSDTTQKIMGKLEEDVEAGSKNLYTVWKELSPDEEDNKNKTIGELKAALDNFADVRTNLKLLKQMLQLQKDDDWHRYQTASILNLYREILDVQGNRFDQNEFEALYLDRHEIRQQFQKFTGNKNTGLSFLLAESGAGKTTFCQKIALDYFKRVNQQIRDTNDILFYLKGSSIMAAEAENSLLNAFSFPGSKLSELFNQLASAERPEQGQFIIIIDGINESDNPSELLSFIVNLARQNRYDFLRIFVTCRIVMWDTISKGIDFPLEIIYPDVAESAGQEEVPFIRLAQFSNLDVEKAYDKYAANRFIKTRFYQLPPFIREICKDPFLLNILTEAYRGTHKNRAVIKPDSVSTIFEKYIFSAKPRKLTRPSIQNPRPKDMQIVQRLLELMWQQRSDTVSEEIVRHDELLSEAIYEPNPVVEKGDIIQCDDLICHWRWQPQEHLDFPFLCPDCRQNTLIWETEDESDFLICQNENCSWKWLPDKNKDILFKDPNGHSLRWSSADYRTPYNRLLDEGILTEIIREDGSYLVRFKYDRIFEYLLARQLLLPNGEQTQNLDYETVLIWTEQLKTVNVSPICWEAVATAVSLAANSVDICRQLLERQKKYHLITACLKKIAIADENGRQQVLDFIDDLIRRQIYLNEIVIPVLFHLRRDSLNSLQYLFNNKNVILNKTGSELLFRISSTDIGDGLFIINALLGSIKPTNILRRTKSIGILLEICLKICTMAEPETVAVIMNIWAAMFRQILGYGRKNPILHLLRDILKFILMTVGSGFIVGKFRQIKIGNTDLYQILFTPSKTKETLLKLAEFMTPRPERIEEIKDILLKSLILAEDDYEGMAFVGLFSILILNIQLRYDDSDRVLSVVEFLFNQGDIYTRWVICSSLNYSLQESYFSSRETKGKPLEKNEVMVDRYRRIMKRFLDEERENYVQDYLRVGDYFFPLGIISQFSFATETDNELIREIINRSLKQDDFQLLRKFLLDIVCFSLDTYCYQRRFWEKTYDILKVLILKLYPMNNDDELIFTDNRTELDIAIIEALAILHYAHPDETELMLMDLANMYKTAANENTRSLVEHFNLRAREAMHRKFQVLRSNTIQTDKKGRAVEVNNITHFVDEFLTGWIYADFTSAIFGRYPAFRLVAQTWMKEPLTSKYEKKPGRFFNKLFSELFSSLQQFQPVIPDFEE
ncbi:MAG: hypothetical protein JW996_03600, partial [Candidatus Cloacimonetes bacterium]|nr:hypothetical protein [Candidatus Cloacimonadota bacterium]